MAGTHAWPTTVADFLSSAFPSYTTMAPWLGALHFLFTFAFLPLTLGLECYYCSSERDTRCLETSRFVAQYQTDQPSECTQEAVDTTLARTHHKIPSPDGEKGNYECIKIEIVQRQGSENKTIIRGCAQGETRKFNPCAHVSQYFPHGGELLHCSTCNTYACNAASTPGRLQLSGLLCSLLAAIAASVHNFT